MQQSWPFSRDHTNCFSYPATDPFLAWLRSCHIYVDFSPKDIRGSRLIGLLIMYIFPEDCSAPHSSSFKYLYVFTWESSTQEAKSSIWLYHHYQPQPSGHRRDTRICSSYLLIWNTLSFSQYRISKLSTTRAYFLAKKPPILQTALISTHILLSCSK